VTLPYYVYIYHVLMESTLPNISLAQPPHFLLPISPSATLGPLLFLSLFLAVLEFELRALCWLRDTLSLEPCLQTLLLWLFLRWGLAFCPGWPGPQFPYFKLPTITGMTGM
jgi:hypothetical protein